MGEGLERVWQFCVVAPICESSTWKAEVGELKIPGLPRLYTQWDEPIQKL